MSAAVIFGVPSDRVQRISDRHALTLAGIHAGAMRVLACDEAVSPRDMMAVVKWQLVAGLVSAIRADIVSGLPVDQQIAEVAMRLKEQLG